MKRYLCALFLTVAGAAYGQQKFVAEELVAVIGNSPVMLSDVETTTQRVIALRKSQGVNSDNSPRQEAIEMLMLQKLLSTTARADSLDKDMNTSSMMMRVEEQVQQMVEQAGSVKQLERQYGKTIYQIKKDIEKDMTDAQLAQTMEHKLRDKTTINYGDVAAFFSRLPQDSLPTMPAQYIYAQIVKVPPATQERKYAIRERMLEFRQRVLNGEKLSVLAALYSHDLGSKPRGGEIGPQDINNFVAPVAEALRAMKPGQISEIVESEYGYHLLELISLRDDMVHYRNLLLKPEFTIPEVNKVTDELDSLSQVITDGKITFKDAAFRYSQDDDSKMNGGRVFNTKQYYNSGGDIKQASTRFMADELGPIDYRALVPLQVGGVSKSFESRNTRTGDVVYKIVQLLKIIPPHPANLNDDYELIEQVALREKQDIQLDKWIHNAVQKMYVWISPKYLELVPEQGGWVESMNNNQHKLLVPNRTL